MPAKCAAFSLRMDEPSPARALYPLNTDLAHFPFDLPVVRNGLMNPCDLKALPMQHEPLRQARTCPIAGDSDYQRARVKRILASPATYVYTHSAGPMDFLQALRQGNSFSNFSCSPWLEMHAGGVLMGHSLPWSGESTITVRLSSLLKGDTLKLSRLPAARSSSSPWRRGWRGEIVALIWQAAAGSAGADFQPNVLPRGALRRGGLTKPTGSSALL